MSIQGLFDEGVNSFQQKDFSKASELFSQALAQQPEDVTLLVNLALARFELGQKFESYALFKKATHLDPESESALQGLEFVKNQIQLREMSRNLEIYEQARSSLVKPISIHFPLGFSLVFFLLSGFLLIRFFADKVKSFRAGEDQRPLSVWGWVSLILFFISLAWTGFYKFDQSIPRGIVKLESLSLRSAPAVNSPTVLELNGGLEVKILRAEDKWLQIQYPGTFSGWVEKEAVLEL